MDWKLQALWMDLLVSLDIANKNGCRMLPPASRVKSVYCYGTSDWTDITRIPVEETDRRESHYFLTSAQNEAGRIQMQGAFSAMSELYKPYNVGFGPKTLRLGKIHGLDVSKIFLSFWVFRYASWAAGAWSALSQACSVTSKKVSLPLVCLGFIPLLTKGIRLRIYHGRVAGLPSLPNSSEMFKPWTLAPTNSGKISIPCRRGWWNMSSLAWLEHLKITER